MRILQGLLVVLCALAAGCSSGDDLLALPDKLPLDAGPHDGGSFDAAVDSGIVDPSGPGAPDIADEPCNQSYTVGAVVYTFAEHVYPGKSAADLSTLHTIGHLAPGEQRIPGYDLRNVSTGTYIADGKAAVFCGPLSMPALSSVTFTLPP